VTVGAAGALLFAGMLPASAATTPSPVGNVDRVTLVPGGVRVFGWAWDADASGPTTVLVKVGGVNRTLETSVQRLDVPRAFPGAGTRQGFDVVVPVAAGSQRVCVTARDVGPGVDTAFPCATLRVPGSSPFGSVDRVAAVAGGIRVHGWSADLDTTAPVAVQVTIDGVRSTLSAALARPDVPRAYPGASPTSGFNATLPAPEGSRMVCIVATDVGPGSDRSYGCRTVSVPTSDTPAPAPSPAPAPAPAPTVAPARPGPTNTGVPAGTVLTRFDGNLVITTPNAVVNGLDIRGFVDVRAPGVIIRNSIIRGQATTTSRGLVTVSSPSYGLTIEDSELAPTTPSPYVDGLRGMNIIARRLNIYGVIDQVHVYGTGNVSLTGSWLHSNAHFSNDPTWGGGPSHDDNVQIQSGTGITLTGNTLTDSHGAAIMLTQDAGAVSDVRIAGNWLDGGACTVNIKTTATPPTRVGLTDNAFGRNAQYRSCGIKVATTIPLDLQRNLYIDGITVTRTP